MATSAWSRHYSLTSFKKIDLSRGGRAVDGNEEVIAYVQPTAGRPLMIAELEAWAKENLTAYKRPTEIILTSELPIGPTGKILKSVLKADLAGSSKQ